MMTVVPCQQDDLQELTMKPGHVSKAYTECAVHSTVHSAVQSAVQLAVHNAVVLELASFASGEHTILAQHPLHALHPGSGHCRRH